MICGLRSGSSLHTEAVPELCNADPGAEDGSSCVFSMCMFVVRVGLEGFFLSYVLSFLVLDVMCCKAYQNYAGGCFCMVRCFLFLSSFFFSSKHEWIKK